MARRDEAWRPAGKPNCPILILPRIFVLGGVLALGWLRVANPTTPPIAWTLRARAPRSSARTRCPNLGSACHAQSPARPDFWGSCFGARTARRVSLSPRNHGTPAHLHNQVWWWSHRTPNPSVLPTFANTRLSPPTLSSPLPLVSSPCIWSPSLDAAPVARSLPAWSLRLESSERQS